MNVVTEIDRFKLQQVKEYSLCNIPHNFQKHPTRKNANSKTNSKVLFSLYKQMHGAQPRNYAGIATGSGRPPGSGCYCCGSPPSSTGSPGLPGTQFDEVCITPLATMQDF